MPEGGTRDLPDVTAIVVTYNHGADLARCVKSLWAAGGPLSEVIVVDNGGDCEVAERLAAEGMARLVRPGVNIGFGAGCNLAAREATGGILFFVNPDAEVWPGCTAALAGALADPGVGIACARLRLHAEPTLLNGIGTCIHPIGISWAAGYRTPVAALDADREIATASGAAMAMRAEVFRELGGFREEFFLYHEDAELSWRARLAGYRIVLVHDADVAHDYDFARHPGKFALADRNRLVFVLTSYSARLLVLLTPLLVASEVAIALVAAKHGWLRGKLTGWAWLLRNRALLRRRRAETQALRRVSDRDLTGRFPATFGEDLARIVRFSFLSPDRTAFLADLDRPGPHGPRRPMDVSTTGNYAPGSYLPAAAAIAAGRAVGASTLVLTYLARLAGLAAYVLIVRAAVRRTPVHPWAFAACGLVPAALGQAATVTADTMTVALGFFVVASALRLALDPAAAGGGRLLEAVGAGAWLGLCKPPYAALALMYVVAAASPHLRGHRRWPLAAFVAAAGTQAAWGRHLAGSVVPADRPARWFVPTAFAYAFRDVDAAAQIRHVLTHPWDLAVVAARTAWRMGPAELGEVVSRLSFYRLPGLVAIAVFVWLAAATRLAPTRTPLPFPPAVRATLAAVTALTAAGVLLVAYSYWNALGAPVIEALPQRYWLPLLPAIVASVAPGPPRRPVAAHVGIFVLAGAAILAFTVAGVALHYTTPPLAAR